MAREKYLVPNLVVIDRHFISQGLKRGVWGCDEFGLVDVDVVGGEIHGLILPRSRFP